MRKGTYIWVALHAETTEARPTSFRPGALHLVTAQEMLELKQWLTRGELPADFESKLALLENRGVMHQFIAQNCRVLVMLLITIYAGMFKEVTARESEELLRLLAYVRKDEDAIPDYSPSGFTDDLHEVRTVISHLQPLVNRFKAWRLCHQVPGMWQN